MLRLTILFDAPYWVGLVEKCRDDRLYVARHVFGAEPSDTEIEAFVLRDLSALMRTMTVGLPSGPPDQGAGGHAPAEQSEFGGAAEDGPRGTRGPAAAQTRCGLGQGEGTPQRPLNGGVAARQIPAG